MEVSEVAVDHQELRASDSVRLELEYLHVENRKERIRADVEVERLRTEANAETERIRAKVSVDIEKVRADVEKGRLYHRDQKDRRNWALRRAATYTLLAILTIGSIGNTFIIWLGTLGQGSLSSFDSGALAVTASGQLLGVTLIVVRRVHSGRRGGSGGVKTAETYE
jgi:hypothetical protein